MTCMYDRKIHRAERRRDREGLRLMVRRGDVSDALIAEARWWIGECAWADVEDADDVAALSPTEVVLGIEQHYSGGWAQFVSDCS